MFASGFGYQAQADIGGGVAEFRINQSNSLPKGSVDQVISVDYLVQDGDSLEIEFKLLAQINGGTFGVVDFSNTAMALIVSDSAVTLTPSDPLFLSDPTFVPLPAGLVLIISALAGLGVLVRRTRRAR